MATELTMSHGSMEEKKDALTKDLKIVANDVAGLMKEVPGSTAEELAAARTKVETRWADARSKLDEARARISEKARGAAGATDALVRENPWKALGLGVAVGGLLIGFLVSLGRGRHTSIEQ